MGPSRALMLEVRKYNISVIAICPGSVATEIFRDESQTVLSSSRESVLQAVRSRESIYRCQCAVNAMISELEIRPTNPRK